MRASGAAAAMASITGTQSSSVLAVSAPIEPPVVSPMWATMMSAPASVMARGLVGVEDVGRGQQVQLARQRDHLDLEAVAHAGLFEVLARNVPSIRPTVGKFCTPAKPDRLQLGAGTRSISRTGRCRRRRPAPACA